MRCTGSVVLVLIVLARTGWGATGEVRFEIDPQAEYEQIRPLWNTLNLWSPTDILNPQGAPQTWLKDTHPFLQRVILMTATGGRPAYPQLEYYTVDARGNPTYDFTNLGSYLSAVLVNGLQPIVVLGAIPLALAPAPYNIGTFGSVTDPPTDYDKWYRFVRALVAFCVDRFGARETAAWQWRLYTEPDNRDWWTGTRQAYFKLYDYTVAAAQHALPDIPFGPGNMLGEIEDHWGTQFIDHAFAGTNYYTGGTGSYMKSFTLSAYERVQTDHPPLARFAGRLKFIKDKLRQYGALDSVTLGFDEGQLLTDEDGTRLWLGDGTEYGASWQAAYQIFGIRQGLERIVQWGFTADGVKTPKYNVIEMLETMAGQTRIAMRKVADTRAPAVLRQQQIDGIAAVAGDGASIRILAYSHNRFRYPGAAVRVDSQSVTLVVRHLPFDADAVRVRQAVIDSTHSNFFNQWLSDSRDVTRYAHDGQGGSRFDAHVTITLQGPGLQFWNDNRSRYLQIDDLQLAGPDTILTIDEDGAVTYELFMRPHQVSLLQLLPYQGDRVDTSASVAPLLPLRGLSFPNPTRGSASIVIRGVRTQTRIELFNLQGQIVRRWMADGQLWDNPVVLEWNGRDATGAPVASGVYLLRLDDGRRTSVHKMMVLR